MMAPTAYTPPKSGSWIKELSFQSKIDSALAPPSAPFVSSAGGSTGRVSPTSRARSIIQNIGALPGRIYSEVKTKGIFNALTGGGVTNKFAGIAVDPYLMIGGFGTSLKKGISSASTWVSRELTANPLAGWEAKTVGQKILKALGGSAIGGASIGAAYSLASYATGGDPNLIKALKKGLLVGTAGGFSKLGAVVGSTRGITENLLEQGKKGLWDPWAHGLGGVSAAPNVQINPPGGISAQDLRDLISGIPTPSFPDLPDLPATYINTTYAPPGISISGGFGGGGIDPSMLLLLAGSAGLLGYAAGRRKKRKKYKRRKSKK